VLTEQRERDVEEREKAMDSEEMAPIGCSFSFGMNTPVGEKRRRIPSMSSKHRRNRLVVARTPPKLPLSLTIAEARQALDSVRKLLPSDQKSTLEPLYALLECALDSPNRSIQLLIRALYQKVVGENCPSLDKTQGVLEAVSACSVKYFHFGSEVGHTFHAQSHTLYCGMSNQTPDGKEQVLMPLIDPSTLQLTPEQAQQAVNCRKRINGGIVLDINEEGEVYLRCLTDRPVFAESHYLDRETTRIPQDALHRIYQQSSVKVYDLWQSFQQMCFWVAHQSVAARKDTRIFQDHAFLNQMHSLCVVRVAFSHPWGTTDNPTIRDTPCWMEIYMNKAIHLMNELLTCPNKAREYLRATGHR
jgi:hypothetical protein